MSTKTNQKINYGCLSLFGIVVLFLAGSTYFFFRFLSVGKALTPLTGATTIPEEALITVFINTNADNWSKLQQFSTPENRKIFEDRVSYWQEKILGNSKINYQEDLQPWLGNIMLAFLSGNQEKYQTLIVVGITNKLKATQFAYQLTKEITREIKIINYRGIPILETFNNRQKIYYTWLNHQLLISSEKQTVQSAIDSFQRKKSLATKFKHEQKRAGKILLQDKYLIQLYWKNYDTLINSLIPSVYLKNKVIVNLKNFQSIFLGIKPEPDGLKLEATYSYSRQNFLGEHSKITPFVTKNISKYPEDTLALITGKNVKKLWLNIVQRMKKVAKIQASLEETRQFFQLLKLDLDREIFGWLDGEFALGLIQSNQSFLSNYYGTKLGGALLLETNNPQVGSNTIKRVEDIAQRSSLIKVKKEEIQGKQITEWEIAPTEVILSYSWLDEQHFLLNLGTPFINIANRKSSLEASNKFKKIQQYLPSNNLGYFYLDLENLMLIINNLPQVQNTPIPPKIKTILNTLKTIAASITIQDNNTGKLDVIFSLKD